MIKFIQSGSSAKIAEIEKGSALISSAGDILDIMGEVSYHDCDSIIIHSDVFSREFFDLNTGIAGEILQKFSNYRMRLVIVGDFAHLGSKSWRDFIRESNRGRSVNFLSSVDEAISVLSA
jgi:hypothetical protein